MKALAAINVIAVIAAAAGAVLAGAVALALVSTGVLSTSGTAWTAEVMVAGRRVRINVPGLVRLATAPGVATLLDGSVWSTQAGNVQVKALNGSLRLKCAPCRVSHRDLSPQPLSVRSIELTIRRAGDTLTGELLVDQVQLPLHATVAGDRIDIEWQLPATPLARVYLALAAAIPEASFARIEGSVRGSGKLSLPSKRGAVAIDMVDVQVGGLGTERLQYGWFALACARAGGQPRRIITGDGEKPWLPADSMGTYLRAAVLAAEDQRFFEHAGFDVTEIALSLGRVEAGQPLRGASTITQQLARTLFTGGERSAMRKLRELLYAIEMERTLGKARILELYLNTVDWGPGLCGAKAAARAYFNKQPARLTPMEAAWLASILRQPHTAHADRFGANTPQHDRARWVLLQMRQFPRGERARWAQAPLAFR